MEPGQGVAWMGEFAAGVRAGRPPVGAVIAPDLSGSSEALDVAAQATGRPVIRVVAVAAEADIPLAALRALDRSLLPGDPLAARDRLVDSHAGAVLVVDDAHWLDDESAMVITSLAARASAHDLGLLVGHRPATSPSMAALDDAVASSGTVIQVDGLTADEVSTRLASRTGRATTGELAAEVYDLTAGRLGLVDLLVDGWTGDPPGAARLATEPLGELVLGALRLRIARLTESERALLTVLSFAPDASDDLLATVTHLDPPSAAAARAALRCAGVVVPGGDTVIPLVARAVAQLTAPEIRRDFERRIGQALHDAHGSVQAAARFLASAGAAGPAAVAQFRAAAEACAATDPDGAIDWYERALDAGGDPTEQAAAHAELLAIVGDLDGAMAKIDVALAVEDVAARGRAGLVAGVVAYRRGHSTQALQFFAEAASTGVAAIGAVADPVVVGVGAPPIVDRARPAEPVDLADRGAALLAQAARGAVEDDPASAFGRFVEAATLLSSSGRAVPVVESPWVLGAMSASVAGDRPAASELLARGRSEVTGLHRAAVAGWSAWLDPSDADVDQSDGSGAVPERAVPERDGLVAAAVAARRARRSGDLGALHAAWRHAETFLLGVQPDLWLVEPAAELAAASTRLDPHERAVAWLQQLEATADRVKVAVAWRVVLAWARLQVGLAADAPVEVAAAAGALRALGQDAELAPGSRALVTAGAAWHAVVEGEIDVDEVDRAVAELLMVGRGWDASRLAGQAAVRSTDPTVARALLARARELSGASADGPDTAAAEGGRSGVLSEREVEVSRLVLEGRTHKEIGGQLFVSPKTVEHHVARIRTKLGAATRAEMIAALHRELD